MGTLLPQTKAPSGERRRPEGGVWEGVPVLSRLEGLRSVVISLSGVQGGAPAGNAFWRILEATEISVSHLYANALSSSNSVSCHITYQVKIWVQGRGLGTISPLPERRNLPRRPHVQCTTAILANKILCNRNL